MCTGLNYKLIFSSWMDMKDEEGNCMYDTLPTTIADIMRYIEFIMAPPFKTKPGNITGGKFATAQQKDQVVFF